MRRVYTGVFILCLAALLLGAPASADGPAVADASQMTAVEEVVEPGMVPVYPESLRDGDYPVELKCSSSMFRVTKAVLHVRGGEMSATLYMHSKSYLFVYPGTAPEADAAPETERVPFEESGEGEGSFTIPVAALDTGVPCAAYSRSKELWYDRTLLFRADSLPEEAFREGFFVTAESLGLEDGDYTVSVSLGGGSGRASVESPCALWVEGGQAFARIVWGSKNYDLMCVGDKEFTPVNAEGNSVFEIPVTRFDRPMAVKARTVAMSEPHLIDYTLRFASDSLERGA